MVMTEFVAFYGSLRYPSTRDGLGISNQIKFVTNALVPGYLVDLGAFPGLIQGHGDVFSDIYQVLDPSVMDRLDGFEGYNKGNPDNSMYLRMSVMPLMFKEIVPDMECWVYYYNGTHKDRPVVEGGDWVQYVASEQKDYYLGRS